MENLLSVQYLKVLLTKKHPYNSRLYNIKLIENDVHPYYLLLNNYILINKIKHISK